MSYFKKYPENQDEQLLYSRKQAAKLLGTSTRTIRRMEREYGLLTPVRITPAATGTVFYRAEELLKVAEGQSS